MTAPTALANGRYLLVSPLGEGGMATVYRAFDQRLQVWRAIKVLAPQYATKPKLRARFETEAQTMALLEHPNIVRVYDVGTDGPSPYIVMELVTGGSLVDWLEAHGAMPARMAVETTLATCDGIQAAHSKGIIHRDIKPHNVMVTAEGACRVTDFGIARVGDGDVSMTKTGAVMGTWGYMAPEQRTNAKGVDVRADIYACGATLYTLLADQMPMDLFAAEPGDSTLEGIGPELVEIILKASEYRREDRYADIPEFCAALRAILPALPETPDGTPPLAMDAGPAPQPPDPTNYRPAPTPVPAQRTDPTFHAVAPIDGGGQQQVAASATITPPGPDLRDLDGTLPPGATMPPQPGSASQVGAQSREVWQPAGQPSFGDMPIPETTPYASQQGRSPGWVGWMALFLVGMLLFIGVGGAGVWVFLQQPPPAGEPNLPIDQIGTPEPVPSVVPERRDTAAPTQVEPTLEPAPTQPAPIVAPVPSPEPVAPVPQPVVPEPVVPQPIPPEPVAPQPQQVVVVVPRTEPTPVPVPGPAPMAQCVTATSPGTASIGGSVAVSATLCSEDGTPVVLWFKATDGSAWESVNMPLRLGRHVQTIQVSDRFSSGIQYYVAAGEHVDGSRRTPKRIRVTP